MKFFERSPFIVCLLILICIFTHWGVSAVGLGLLHADFAPGPMLADEFRNGNWSAFVYGLPYGGVLLTALRAPWGSIWENIFPGPEAFVKGQMAFTFVFKPVLMTLTSYFLVRAYCSRFAAFMVGLTAAIGFQYWLTQYGNDIYICYLILGSALLAWRAKLTNPFFELTPVKLFFASILCGLALYTSRASMLYIVAFFLPWAWFKSEMSRAFSPKDRTEQGLLIAGVFFLAFFLYLEVFGPEFGIVFGKKIRLHAEPNLRISGFVFLLLGLKIHFREISFPMIRRAFIAFTGLMIGFLPEILHWTNLRQMPPKGTWGNYGFEDSMRALGKVPSSLREFFVGGPGIGQNASLILLLAAIYFFIRTAKRDRRFEAAAAVAVLALYSYCRVLTYTFAPARYLLPILPALLLGMGIFWDELKARSKTALAIGIFLMSLHSAHHLFSRDDLIEDTRKSGKIEQAHEIVERFQQAQVPLVISDNYWHSNQYTVVSRFHPIFITSEPTALRPPQANPLAATVTRVGVLFGKDKAVGEQEVFKLADRSWKLKPLAVVGDRALYIGELAQP